jgi:hypothetical protein
MQRVIQVLFIILAATACGSIQTPPGARSSTDTRLETTSLAHGLASANPAPHRSIADADSGSAAGPGTERAVGAVALAAGVAAVIIFAMVFYKLAKMFSP